MKKIVSRLALLLIFLLTVAVADLLISPKPPLLDDLEYGRAALDAKGNILRLVLSKDDKYRLKIHFDQIPNDAITTLLHYEDKFFYYHPGVNIFALVRGAFSTIFGDRKVGASTITMQVARMRYGLKTDAVAGKLEQIRKALLLELHYSKSEILEAYFNLAPYGGNIEGLEAAARVYFHKGAHALTRSEIIALTVIPQNPLRRHPIYGKDFDLARTRLMQSLFAEIAPAKLAVYKQEQIPFKAPHFVNAILADSDKQNIDATLDSNLQLVLEKLIKNFTDRGARYGLKNASAMLVDSTSQAVVALTGSADFFDSHIQGQIDGTNSRRSPGSTLKPFIYALALDQGKIHPQTILMDSPRSFGGYDPDNFDRGFKGPISAKDALQSSRNLPAISLIEQLRNPDLYDFLQQAQITFKHDVSFYGLALALGGAEITMRQLAGLYAMLANGGHWQPLIYTKNTPAGLSRRLLSPEAAYLTLWMLEKPDLIVKSRGGAFPVYCKTGTSNGFRDAWTAGIFGQYVLVVWVGNFDNTPNPYLVGAQTALPLFMEIAQAIAAISQLHNCNILEYKSLNITEVDVCNATGDFDMEHCPKIAKTFIIPGVSPVRSRGIIREVWIDKKTGLRACSSENAESKWYEFWPTDALQIFAQAGISKPSVPDWLPECKTGFIQSSDYKKPKIILPKKRVTYQRKISENNWTLPLQAVSEPDVKTLYWYDNENFIGAAKPGEVLLWPVAAGAHKIKVVDDQGRSVSQNCKIEALP